MTSAPTRCVLTYEHWDGLTVDILKAFLLLWNGVKNISLKGSLCTSLVEANASIDWQRIHRWRTYSVDDPGERPEEDVVIQEWLMDRHMHLLILSGKVTLSKHLKGLDLATGTFHPVGTAPPGVARTVQSAAPTAAPVNAGPSSPDGSSLLPVQVSRPSVGPAAGDTSGVANAGDVSDPADPGAGDPSVSNAPTAEAQAAVQPGMADVSPPVRPDEALPPAPQAGDISGQAVQGTVPLSQKIARLLNMTTGSVDEDRELLGDCIEFVGFKTKDNEEPSWGSDSLPHRLDGRLFAKSDVALYGHDSRPDTLYPRGKSVFVIMKNADLRYSPALKTVIIKGADVFKALAADVRFLGGNVCFTVPVAMHGVVLDFAVGVVDSDGVAHPNTGIYLHTIPQDPDMSSPSFRRIRFGVQFRVDPFSDNDSRSQSAHQTDVDDDDAESILSQELEPAADADSGRASSRAKKGNLTLDLAQVEWLRSANNGAYLNDDAIKLLRSTPPKSKFPYDVVVKIAHTIFDIARTGWLPDTAPDPAQGTKIRYSAIGRFVGRSAGWVGAAVKLQEQLQAFKGDPDVRDRLQRRRHGLVGVKTLLNEIKRSVEGMREPEGAEPDGDQDGEDGEGNDGEGGGEGVEGEEEDGDNDRDADGVDDDDMNLYAGEMPPKGVSYGTRIGDDSDQSMD